MVAVRIPVRQQHCPIASKFLAVEESFLRMDRSPGYDVGIGLSEQSVTSEGIVWNGLQRAHKPAICAWGHEHQIF